MKPRKKPRFNGKSGKRIVGLADLLLAAHNRRSVFVPHVPCWGKPVPAAFMINQQGYVLYRLFNNGMYIYEKGGWQDE